LVLAVIAVVLIKSLMSVVSREEGATVPPWAVDNSSTPVTDLTTYEPTIELRATVNDDVRPFLLPAVTEPAGVEQPQAESVDVTPQTQQQRSRRSTRS
jgi:hypothetical protein